MIFQRTSLGKNLLALLLPLTFVWSWAACSLLCSEIIEHHEKQSASSVERRSAPGLVGLDTDECPYTATAAVLEARQNLHTPVVLAFNDVSVISPLFSFTPRSIYAADLNQNSPPPISTGPPIYLRYRIFRI